MRRALSTVLLLVSTTAHAQEPPPPTNRQVAEGHLHVARDAARAGHCDVVLDLSKQVEQLDPQFHAASFKTDAAIAVCLAQAPPPEPAPEPVLAPPSKAPRQGAMTIDPEAPPQREGVQPRALTVAPSGHVVRPDREGTPPLDGGRVLGEVVVGALVAIPGGLVGGLIGAGLCDDDGDEFLGCLGPALIGLYVGGIVGCSAGVYLVGTAGDHDGSFAAAFLGGVVGGAVGLVGLADDATIPLLIASPIVGSVIGFNLSRKWDDDSRFALLPVDRGAGIAWSRRW